MLPVILYLELFHLNVISHSLSGIWLNVTVIPVKYRNNEGNGAVLLSFNPENNKARQTMFDVYDILTLVKNNIKVAYIFLMYMKKIWTEM